MPNQAQASESANGKISCGIQQRTQQSVAQMVRLTMVTSVRVVLCTTFSLVVVEFQYVKSIQNMAL